MKIKYHYLVTTEQNAYMCQPYKEMKVYDLSYPLNTVKGIKKFLHCLDPKRYYTYLVILFIYPLGND